MAKNTSLERKLSILKELIVAITCTSNLDSITNLVLDLALEYTEAMSGSILLLDESGDLIIHAARGMDPSLIEQIRVKIGEQICGKVAKDRQPLYVKNIQNSDILHKDSSRYRGRSFICCPIVMKDRLLGVININEKLDNKVFTDDDFDFTRLLAGYAAVAIEQARLVSELKTQRDDLNKRIKELINAERLRTELITSISHELRTPLNSIKGAIYYLKDKRLSRTEEKEFLHIISSETDRLIDLVDTILDQYIPEAHEKLTKMGIINPYDALREAIDTPVIQNLILSRNITLNLTSPELISNIPGDKLRIVRAFIYTISGIISLMSWGEKIEIKLSEKRKRIELHILAHGLGLSKERLYSLFDERAIWYHKNDRMLKLRLYLARKTIDQHQGTLEMKNTSKGLLTVISLLKYETNYLDVRLDEFLKRFITYISMITNTGRCSIFLYDKRGDLSLRATVGIDEEALEDVRIKPGDGICGRIILEGNPYLSEDIERDPKFRKKNYPPYVSRSFICVPIKIRERVIGVLNLTNRRDKSIMDINDLRLARLISDKIAYLIEKIHSPDLDDFLFRRLTDSIDSLVYASMKYSKDGVITDLVSNIMEKLGIHEEEIDRAIYASRVYDIGLTQIDENITGKAGKLSEVEKKIIRTHPFPAVRLLRDIDPDQELMRAILHHHERYDGRGYPSGLMSDEIPLISKVLSVVDSYVAMIQDRPYRKAMDRDSAIHEIISQSGAQFDPVVVEAFKGSLQEFLKTVS